MKTCPTNLASWSPRSTWQRHRPTAAALLLGLAFALPAQALPPSSLPASPLPPNAETRDEQMLIFLCRLAPQAPLQPAQAPPEERPLLCLVTDVDQTALQMEPARFDELLDAAARGGRMSVMLLHPEP